MELYKNYLDEIESRKQQSLKPKPIDDGSLLKEIIFHIKDNYKSLNYTNIKKCI